MGIWTLIKSGLQSMLSRQRHKKHSEKPTKEAIKTGYTTGEIRVHKLIAGPYSLSDVDPSFDSDEEEDYYWIDALVEFDGHLEELTIAHHDFDKIYEIVKHLGSPTVEPFILGKEE